MQSPTKLTIRDDIRAKRNGSGPGRANAAGPAPIESREPSTIHRIVAEQPPRSPADIISLQRSIGNQAVQRILRNSADCEVQRAGSDRASPVVLQRVETNEEPDPSKDAFKGLLYSEMNQRIQADGTYQATGDIEVAENGALFIEVWNKAVAETYHDPDKPTTSTQEKLHIPATAEDVEQRSNIVTDICLKHGIRNFKVARQEKLANKRSGSQFSFEALRDAGLVDDRDYDPGQGITHYIQQALEPSRKQQLRKFLAIDQQRFDGLAPGALANDLMAVLDGKVADAGFFPEEQTGREITVYILPDFKSNEEWTRFVADLSTRFQQAGLPRLPIASGDEGIVDDSQIVDGQTLGYFSYRNEGIAFDKSLGYHGFPHWLGGNAAEYNAARQNLTFATVSLAPEEVAATAHQGKAARIQSLVNAMFAKATKVFKRKTPAKA